MERQQWSVPLTDCEGSRSGDGAMPISFPVSPCGDESDMKVDINAGFPYHRYEARHRILI